MANTAVTNTPKRASHTPHQVLQAITAPLRATYCAHELHTQRSTMSRSFGTEAPSRAVRRSPPRAPNAPSVDPATVPQEPAFFPKLQAHFADFPCLHSLNGPEPFKLEDLLRFTVRPCGRIIHSARFSRFVEYAAAHAQGARLPAFTLHLRINRFRSARF